MESKRSEILSRVVKVFESALSSGHKESLKGINLNTDIYDDLGIDSLELLDVLNGLEEEFGVSPDQYEANSKRKISEIVDYVTELLIQKNGT